MACPKCKAKIGVMWEKITIDSGQVSGGICYMCGHWIQDNILVANHMNFGREIGRIVG